MLFQFAWRAITALGDMANTSRRFTPTGSDKTPSNKKFIFKKPGARPFTSGNSESTPYLSRENIEHLSTENPCNSKSGSFDSASLETNYGETDTGSSKQRTTQSEDSETVTRHSKKVPYEMPCSTNQLRGQRQLGVSNFNKETPFIHAHSKQKPLVDLGIGRKTCSTSSRDKENEASPVSSAYFSRPSSSGIVPKLKKKVKRHPRVGHVPSSLSGSQSFSLEVDSSVAMESEAEGDISVENVGQLWTTERLEDMSTDNQVCKIPMLRLLL